MEKVKCLKCGSTNLYAWVEHTSTYYYRLDKDGDYDINKDTPVMTFQDGTTGAHGYRCKDCDCMWNSISGNILN